MKYIKIKKLYVITIKALSWTAWYSKLYHMYIVKLILVISLFVVVSWFFLIQFIFILRGCANKLVRKFVNTLHVQTNVTLHALTVPLFIANNDTTIRIHPTVYNMIKAHEYLHNIICFPQNIYSICMWIYYWTSFYRGFTRSGSIWILKAKSI